MISERLTEHFWRHEFACKGTQCCGHSAPVDMRLVYALERLRMACGRPLIVQSGFRCRAHNDEIPGASDTSLHTVGMAADVLLPKGMTADELIAMALEIQPFAEGGIGKYYNRLHLDIRTSGKARW